MTLSGTSSFLRRVLLADAAISGATGLLMTFGSGLFENLLEVPAALLHYAGLSLLPFAALVVYIGTRENLTRPAVWAVIVLNALWAADSILLLVSGWVAPTGLGYAFIVAQAVVVAIFAELQYVGLRRSAAATAAA
jgi:hypothetical protein